MMVAMIRFEGFKTIDFLVLDEIYTKLHLEFKKPRDILTISSWKEMRSSRKTLRVLTHYNNYLSYALFD